MVRKWIVKYEIYKFKGKHKENDSIIVKANTKEKAKIYAIKKIQSYEYHNFQITSVELWDSGSY